MPTRGTYLLDLILTNSDDLVENVSVEDEFSSSDHRIVKFLLKFSSDKVVNNRSVPCFRDANFQILRDKLKEKFSMKLSEGVVNQLSEFSDNFNFVLREVVPFVRI